MIAKSRNLLGVLIHLLLFPLVVTAGDVEVGEEVVRAAIGSGPNDIGMLKGNESASEGPMSFAVDDVGKIYVLDQINSRIQVFKNGVRTETIPAARTYEDIDLSSQGRIFLLERNHWKIIVSIDHKGTLLTQAKLVGVGITEASSVNIIDTRDDGVWAQLFTHSVRVTDTDGKATADRFIVEGRYSVTGRYLVKSKVIGEVTANVMRRPTDAARWKTFSILFDKPISYLTVLDTDSADRIYLGAKLIEAGIYSEIIVVLGSNGKEERRINILPSNSDEETNRKLRVMPDGTIYQLGRDGSSVVVRKYAP